MVYLLVGLFCLRYCGLGYISVAYLPAGIALAAALHFGLPVAVPSVLIGTFFLNCLSLQDYAGITWPIAVISASIAIGNAIQVVIATWIFRRFVSSPLQLETDRQILQFMLMVPLVSVFSASINAPILAAAGFNNYFSSWANWAGWWLGDAVGTLIAVPLTISVLDKSSSLWRQRRYIMGLPVVMLFVTVILISESVARFEIADTENRFRIRTQEVGTLFQIALNSQELVQDSVAQLFVSSDQVTRSEFRAFVRWATSKNPDIQVIEWLPKVTQSQRNDYEKKQQTYFGPAFSITDITEDKQLVVARERETYFPITYLEPESNQMAPGFDPTSSLVSNAAIQTAIASGSTYARPPLVLVEENYQARVLMLYRPVYEDAEGGMTLDKSAAQLAGLVNVAIRAEDFVENILGRSEETEFVIRWQDVLSGEFYYDLPLETAPVFSHNVNIMAAGREMRLIFSPTQLFLAHNQSSQALFVMIAGYLLTGLLMALILSITGRTHQVSKEVSRRTEQLSNATERAISSEKRIREVLAQVQQTQTRLKLSDVAFNAASEGFLITDASRQVIAVNAAYVQITGFSESEVLGQFPKLLDQTLNDEVIFRKLWVDLNQHGLWRGELLSRRKDGEIFSVYLSMSVVRNEQQLPSHYVAVFTDISESKQAQLIIEHHANFDLLTGLPNRRLFNDRLAQEIRHAQRDKKKLCLLFLDLDRFKDINDTLGHDAGDELLQNMASRIQSCLRESDTVARLGGDEFTVILSGLEDVDNAVQIAQKIIDAIQQPLKIHNQAIRITTSIGLTVYPDDGATPGLLLQNADRAMYSAKDANGGVYRRYNAELESTWQSRAFILHELETALAEGQFEIYYQPVIHARNGAISAEALVRWRHPERGVISPAEFLPVAERMGLIGKIDDFVFAQVCFQIRHWQDNGMGDIAVSINRSAQDFGNLTGRLDWVDYIQQHEIASHLLTLEITEGVLLQRSTETRNLLRHLRHFGVRISIDDFGTGYSSLAYLKQLEVDYLKIDKSFIRDLETDANDKAIIEAIIVMAKRLDIGIVAEGVETESQLRLLTELGCDWIQGFYYARPMACPDFEQFVRDWRKNVSLGKHIF
ncbi:EAL domain-containing protein [Methylophaga frappieri]